MMLRTLILLVVTVMVQVAKGESSACYPPFQEVGGMCIYINTAYNFTWLEARDYCESIGGDAAPSDLAIIPNCDTFVTLTGFLGFNVPPRSSLWVGAHTEFTANNWRWLDGEVLATGVPYWAYRQGHDEGQDCAAMNGYSYFQLADYDCDEPRMSICSMSTQREIREDPLAPVLNCPTDSIQVGEYCYWFSDNPMTWSSAEDYCRSNFSTNRGELFSPDSCDEFTKLAHHLEVAERNRSHWAGAVDVSGHQEWFWVNGDPVPGGTPYWATDMPHDDLESGPHEYCGLMAPGKHFYLMDQLCLDKRYFTCKLHEAT